MNDLLPERKHSQWLNGKPFVVTAQTHTSFANVKKPFLCKLCGHVFAVGDNARWIYANSTPGQGTGNFFVCASCDGEQADVLARGKAAFTTALTLAKRWGLYEP